MLRLEGGAALGVRGQDQDGRPHRAVGVEPRPGAPVEHRGEGVGVDGGEGLGAGGDGVGVDAVGVGAAGGVRGPTEQRFIGADGCVLGLEPADVLVEHPEDRREDPVEALVVQHVRRRVLEDHGRHQRVALLGQDHGHDRAQRVAHDDGGLAQRLEEGVGVADVGLQPVPTGRVAGAAVAPEVQRPGPAADGDPLEDRHEARGGAREPVEGDDRRAAGADGPGHGEGGPVGGGQCGGGDGAHDQEA
jgi:hypothetical protein